MKKSNYYKATLTVVIASLGFLTLYSWRNSFWGGLIYSGCAAAMIGGLADWFAVTALFRRPLGIRPGRIIRTEIIPRNRERIFAALVNMVQDDLLTPQVVRNALDRLDLVEFSLDHLEDARVKQELYRLLERILEGIIPGFVDSTPEKLIDKLLAALSDRVNPSAALAELIRFSLAKGYDERILELVLDELILLVNQEQSRVVIFRILKEALTLYEKGMDRRKFANNFILAISPVSLTELVHTKSVEYLRQVRERKGHPLRQKYRDKIQQLLVDLQHSQEFQHSLAAWKQRLVNENPALGKYLGELLLSSCKLPQEDNRTTQLTNLIERVIDRQISKFKLDSASQFKLNEYLRGLIVKELDEHHAMLGRLVKERLDKLNKHQLVALIEDKAGNDLQMIRINGSIVGGVVGILIYLVTFWFM